MEIVGAVVVAVLAIVISPILKGLVNKFVEEDRLEEEANKHEAVSETRKKGKKKEADTKALKVKLKPEWDWKVAAVFAASEVVLWVWFGLSVTFFVYAFLTGLLVLCMFADIKGCIIPNEVNFVGFLVGIVLAFWKMNVNVNEGLDAIFGMLAGFGIFMAIAGLSLLLYKKEGMGGGDIKLMGVLGLYVGLFNNIQIFILSFFFAAVISITLLVTKRKKGDDYIPFGPFIVLAAYVTMLFPASVTMPTILHWLR